MIVGKYASITAMLLAFFSVFFHPGKNVTFDSAAVPGQNPVAVGVPPDPYDS